MPYCIVAIWFAGEWWFCEVRQAATEKAQMRCDSTSASSVTTIIFVVIFMREVPHNVIALVKNVVDLRKVLRKLHAHLGSAIRSFQSRSCPWQLRTRQCTTRSTWERVINLYPNPLTYQLRYQSPIYVLSVDNFP